jgi:rubrerythrin
MVDHNELKTDIALIKKDISQIESTISKLDSTLEQIILISKTQAIQERVVENHEKRLDDLSKKLAKHNQDEEQFRKELQTQIQNISVSNRQHIDDMKTFNTIEREKRHKEIMESIKAVRDELKEKNKEQDSRLSKLENWRWWIMGIGVAATTIVTLLWKTFVG